jgi:hypothetical protein
VESLFNPILQVIAVDEKRTLSRNMAVTIGLVSLILLINSVWAVANYTTILKSKNSQIQQANAQLTNLNAQYQDALLQEQSLNQQVGSLQAIRLWEINFKWEFNEPSSGQHYLNFTGTFFNSGNTTATAVRADIWISAGSPSGASFKVDFGDVPAKSYINFDKVLNYTGHAESYTYMVD